ncbi:MAG: hypothetical protein IAF08_12755 [Rhizobacter sp.]|nr:hypothetical protein [Chlorobiales bacterium]
MHRLKAIFLPGFLLLVFTLCLIPYHLLIAGASVSLRAIPSSDRIYIRWTSSAESQMTRYDLYREMPNTEPQFLQSLAPNGSGSTYEYIDLNVGKAATAMSGTNYTYLLRIVAADGTTEVRASVGYETSSTRRTWGSIKALFR